MKTLLTEEQIRDGVARLADEIANHYGSAPVTIVGVMTGSLVLLADLIRRLEMPLRVGVIQARSYRGAATSRGSLSIDASWLTDVTDRDVLLVDDIFDTGHTLLETISQLDALRPTSIRSAVLLRKSARQEVALQPDFVAFEIPNRFVVGYGLDHNGLYRNLPYIAALEDEELP